MRSTCSNRTQIQNTNSAQRQCAHSQNIYIWVLSSIAEKNKKKTSKHKTVLTVLLQNKGLPVNSAHQRFPHVELRYSSKLSLPLHFSSTQLLHGNSATVERSSGGDAIDLSRDLRSSPGGKHKRRRSGGSLYAPLDLCQARLRRRRRRSNT